MMPMNECVQQRVMATAAFYAMLLARLFAISGKLLAPFPLCRKGLQHVALFATLQAALARGALLASDVRLWLKLVSTPIVGSLCKLLPAFRSRMLGNPRFLMVLAIEEAIGVAAKWSAEKSSRKDKFWKVCGCAHVLLLLHSLVSSISILASMQSVPSGGLRGQQRNGLLVIGHCDV